MANTDEAFCLKWNDFQESISSSLGGLLHCSDLQDVTLQCGPQSLQCHRLVLAACSDWFRQIFKTVNNNNNKHPVIVLWDAAARDMKLLLDFMYNGVVNVKQEHLNSFLALAERLSVRFVLILIYFTLLFHEICIQGSDTEPNREARQYSNKSSSETF